MAGILAHRFIGIKGAMEKREKKKRGGSIVEILTPEPRRRKGGKRERAAGIRRVRARKEKKEKREIFHLPDKNKGKGRKKKKEKREEEGKKGDRHALLVNFKRILLALEKEGGGEKDCSAHAGFRGKKRGKKKEPPANLAIM